MGFSKLWRWSALVVTACAGSQPTAKPPNVAADGAPLQLKSDEPDLGLRLVSAAPEGEIDSEAVQIHLLFTRPMRALGLAGQQPTPPIAIEPNIEGAWNWVGTNGLLFVPNKDAVEPATKYTVRVPSSLLALDGSPLKEGREFSFETERPRFVGAYALNPDTDPEAMDQGPLHPDSTIVVEFSQPVTPTALKAALTVTATERGQEDAPSRPVEVEISRPNDKTPRRLQLAPTQALPLNTNFRLTVSNKLRGELGPLPMAKAETHVLETYAPLQPTMWCNDKCLSPAVISFNNSIDTKRARSAIRISPAIPHRISFVRNGNDDSVREVQIHANFKPGKRYEISVEPTVKDEYGQTLAERFSSQFIIGKAWPNINLGAESGFIEPGLGSGPLIASVNLAQYDLLTAALTPDQVLDWYRTQWDTDNPTLPLLQRQRIEPAERINLQQNERVSFSSIAGKRFGAKLIGFEASWQSPVSDKPETAKQTALLHPTDLAVSSRLSRDGGAVWVTRMSDGTPVAGADVRLVGVEGFTKTYRTDSGGVALIRDRLPELPDNRRGGLVVAESDDDWSYSFLPRLEQRSYRQLGEVFVDRGIYRPGEPVYVKGWAREELERDSAPISGQEVQLTLKRGDVEVDQVTTLTNAFGGFSARFELPLQSPLQAHYVVAKSGTIVVYARLSVGEYRPSEFTVTVTPDSRQLTRGQQLSGKLVGEYLFGGPMADVHGTYQPFSERAIFTPKDTNGFSTDAWTHQTLLMTRPEIQQLFMSAHKDNGRTITLDASGTASFKTTTALEMFGAAQVGVSATILDKSRQTVSARGSALVHPGDFYLGVRRPEVKTKAGQQLRPQVIAVTPEGQRVAGKSVRLSLYDGPGWWYRESFEPKLLGECQVTTGNAPVSCPLRPPKGGSYVVLARAVDDRQNPILASVDVDVEGRRENPFESFHVEHVEVRTDKSSYRAGETCKVLVTTPFKNAPVLLTLEERGVLWSEQQRAKGHVAQFEVPVSDRIERNATLVAQTTRGSGGIKFNEEQSYRDWGKGPQLRTGSARIDIDQSHKRLKVDVSPASLDVKPGSTVPVTIHVADARGKPEPVEVAVYAVDEGVLQLTSYDTPQLLSAFTPPREDLINAEDSRQHMGWLYRPMIQMYAGGTGQGFGAGRVRLGGSHKTRAPKVRMGMTSVTPAQPPRGDFSTTPFFKANVQTDAQGNATVQVKLSDSITSYRIMAVAVGKRDRFGSGEASIRTNLPLMARPALPRFARVGDTFEAGVIVTTNGVNPGQVLVNAKAEGARIEGPAQKSAKLGKDQTQEVRFKFVAGKAGDAALVFEVAAGNFRDSVRILLPVQLPATPEAVAAYGKTQSTRAEQLADLSQASRDFGKLDVKLASTALVGLDSGMDQLVQYPWGCTEQLSSKLMPLLPLSDLAKDFEIPLPEDVSGMIDATLAQILGRQHYSGGFKLWPESAAASPWLTAYVLTVLHEAKQRGRAVPDRALSKAKRYLIDHVESYLDDTDHDDLSRPTMAFATYVLTKYGDPQWRWLKYLMDSHNQADPTFAHALALQAFVHAKRHYSDRPGNVTPKSQQLRDNWLSTHIDKLTKLLEGRLRVSGNRAFVRGKENGDWRHLFDSGTRTNAMVLEALLLANPEHPLADRLARELLAARVGGTWRNTQETSYALLALDRYRHVQEPSVPNFNAVVWLGERKLGTTRHRGRSARAQTLELAMSQLPSTGTSLAFQKQGEGQLFYEALLTYSPKKLPTASLDRGFHVQHRFYRLDSEGLSQEAIYGAAPSERLFRAGEPALGDVIVITPTRRNYVVIEAPLPAGFEALDVLLDTNREDPLSQLDLSGAHVGFTRIPNYRRELRDNKVVYFIDQLEPGMYRFNFVVRATTKGTFVVPAARAEEMYAPEIFGRDAAKTIEVR